MKKKLLHSVLLMCLAFTPIAQAYWWRFSNFTSSALLLKVKLLAHKNEHYAVVLPNQSHLFDWSPPHALAGFCLESIEWAQAPLSSLQENDLVDDDYNIVDNQEIKKFVATQPSLIFAHAELDFYASDAYKRIVKDAGSLFGKKLMKWAANIYARSSCRSRNITIMENENNEIYFVTQKE